MVGVQRAFVFLSELDFKSDIQSFRVMWQLLKSKHQGDWSKYKWILKRSFFLDTLYIITYKQITKKQKISTSNPPPDFSEVQPLLLEKPGRAENRMRAFLAFTRGFSQTCTNKQNLPPYVFSGYIKEKNRSLYKHCTFRQLENSVCHSENYFQFQFGLRSTDCFTHLQNWIRPSA